MRLPGLRRGRLAALLAAGLVAATALLTAPAQARQSQPRPVSPRGELGVDERATIDVFRRASQSVVYITTLSRVVNPWTRNVSEVPRGTGSGFFWDEQGHVVTNYHVIAGANGAQVRTHDQRAFPADLVGVSPELDIAVLRVKVADHRPAPLPVGTSRDLLVGQKVIAIGNPFGLDYTLTTGVVSALNRTISGEQGGAIQGLIQTDAAINPGNSGGPALDSAGRLIGMNTAIYSPSGASAGVGFAVPVDVVNRVVPEIVATGRYARPQLGIIIDEGINRQLIAQMGVKGVVVLDVQRGSPAAKAGLRGSRLGHDGSVVPGDVIQAIDRTPIDGVDALQRVLGEHGAGDKLTLRIWRQGQVQDVVITLAASRSGGD